MTLLSSSLGGGRTEVALVSHGVLRRLLARWDARIALAIVLGVVVVALAGPWFTVDPDVPDYADQLAPPSVGSLLGTDNSGRDLLARTVHGARVSLGAA